MSLVEHLTELRARLIVSLLAVTAGGVVAFFFYARIIDLLIAPYCDVLPPGQTCALVIRDPLEGFGSRLKVAGWGGLMLASPVVFWQIWRFVTPALHDREKRYAVPFVASSVVLFAAGIAVAVLTFPRALGFLVAVGGPDIQPLFSPSSYLTFVILMALAFGVAFEFPVVLVFLQVAGVLSSRRLRSTRRHAAVIIVAAAAIITPSQDPWSLLAMAGPMYLFYEGAIVIGRVLGR